MLRIQDLKKSYGTQLLFDGASMQMGPGERLGLVGRNGHGKSTLFRLILGEEHEDGGSITKPKNYRIGHLAQHLHFTKPTILEEGCLGLLPEEEWEHWKVERILFGLGFSAEDMARSPQEFSGGYQIRLNLAKVLVSNPNLLLLDEPTNYLDIVSIRWLTKFLNEWENEIIIISHDRDFMDSVTTHTALIHRQKIRKVQGNTAKLYAQIEQEDETYEKTREKEEKQRKHAEAFIDRFRAQAGRAAMVQSRIKQLEKMPEKEELQQERNLDFDFHFAEFPAKMVMEASDLSFSYKKNVPLIPKLDLTIHAQDRIAIIGKNGKGKSTLLNLLAGELKPLTGSIKTHPNMQLGYFGQTNISRLDEKLTVEQEINVSNPKLSRTQVRGIAGAMMFSGELADKKVKSLSGGEKSRVLLGKILAQPANLLFLDEPTNHLDMQSISSLVDSIQNFPGAVVVVTHSEEILRRIATKLVIFHRGKAELFLGTYDEFLERIGWEDEGY
jgi:ATP-binding cassette subfamily F protein 3